MPNFQDVSTLGKIISYSSAKEGDLLINYGTYLGQTSNQYGPLYNFEEVETGEKLALAKCGKLDWLVTSGVLKHGHRYQVRYLGKKIMDKGTWKGKEYADIEVLEDRDFSPEASVVRDLQSNEISETQGSDSDDLLA